VRRALLFMLALSACRGPNSQVIVIVDAQQGVREAARGLRVEIFGGVRGANEPPGQLVHYVIEPIEDRDQFWPRTYALAPLDYDATRLYRFDATGLDGTSEGAGFVVATRVISNYNPGEIVQVRLLLADGCIGVPCEDPRFTCDPATSRCTLDSMRDPDGPFDPEAGVPDAGRFVPACDDDADCDDEVACTANVCADGACQFLARHDQCQDEVACTTGVCTPTGCTQTTDDSQCADSISCTDDACTTSGCTHTANDDRCTQFAGGACDVTNDCQYPGCEVGTTCVALNDCQGTPTCDVDGTCVRPALCGAGPCCHGVCTGCDDGNPCTTDTCGATRCENENNTSACSDANPCTIGDQCSGGGCRSGTFRPCGDGIECTFDPMCDPGTGMCPTPIDLTGTPCSNGDSCAGDTCSAGACIPNTCGSDGGGFDAGRDAGRDGGRDGGRDAGHDAGREGGITDSGSGCTICPDDGNPCTFAVCPSCIQQTMSGCTTCPGGFACGGGATCCGAGMCCSMGSTCCGGSCCSAGMVCNPLPVPHCEPPSMCPGGCPGGTCCWTGSAYVCMDGGVCSISDDAGF
jgi:hypothetical protein